MSEKTDFKVHGITYNLQSTKVEDLNCKFEYLEAGATGTNYLIKSYYFLLVNMCLSRVSLQ